MSKAFVRTCDTSAIVNGGGYRFACMFISLLSSGVTYQRLAFIWRWHGRHAALMFLYLLLCPSSHGWQMLLSGSGVFVASSVCYYGQKAPSVSSTAPRRPENAAKITQSKRGQLQVPRDTTFWAWLTYHVGIDDVSRHQSLLCWLHLPCRKYHICTNIFFIKLL